MFSKNSLQELCQCILLTPLGSLFLNSGTIIHSGQWLWKTPGFKIALNMSARCPDKISADSIKHAFNNWSPAADLFFRKERISFIFFYRPIHQNCYRLMKAHNRERSILLSLRHAHRLNPVAMKKNNKKIR